MRGGSALLRRQIILITLLVAAVALVLITVNLAQLTRSLIERTREQAETTALQTAAVAETALVAAPDETPQRAISESQTAREYTEAVVKRGAPLTSLVIEDRDGTPLLQYPRDAGHTKNPSLDELVSASFITQARTILARSNRASFEYSRALEYRGQEFARVRVGVSLESLRREITRALIINLLIALASVAAATFIAISSARLITAPLRVITSSIKQLERADENAADESAANSKQEKIHHTDIDEVADRIEQISRQIAGDRSELREARGRLQQILSNLHERLLLVSFDGRVMLASPGVEQLIGAHDITEGRLLEEIVGKDHPLVTLVNRTLVSRVTLARATISPTNGHNSQPIVASVQPITDRGEMVGALVSLHDRETVAKLETQLDYSERLADFARITSGIAHEVKNPLNAMVIHLELLRSKLERISPEADDARPQLDILTAEIQRLDRVVQTFLDFTRPPHINLRPLDVNRVLEETLALAQPEAEAHGSHVLRSFSTDLPKIAGDADILKQAFLNVIINGFQAMEHGGQLRVETARDGERRVRVSITDHGAGIDAAARSRIFHLYYTTKPGGNGIGLAQAFRAVQLHNGQITFDSQPGISTTFHIRIPTASLQ